MHLDLLKPSIQAEELLLFQKQAPYLTPPVSTQVLLLVISPYKFTSFA
jgi:hypothetical protein